VKRITKFNNVVTNIMEIVDKHKQDRVVSGTDTSSNLIEFAMVDMQKSEVMNKFEEELKVVVGKHNW